MPEVPTRTSAVRTRIPDKRMPKITRAMNTLSQEVNAEAVILTAGGELIAYTGRLSAEGADSLAQAVGESWHTSARVARILGREQQHFEQSVEGDEHLFYSLTVREDIVLSVALRTRVPLGMIRHRAKAAAEALRNLVAVI
jgi:predicted regulator of Ras-like GTPase activity (Roadblock/LC7/MglB family)